MSEREQVRAAAALLAEGLVEEARLRLSALPMGSLDDDTLEYAYLVLLEAGELPWASQAASELKVRGREVEYVEGVATDLLTGSQASLSELDAEEEADEALFARPEIPSAALPARFLEWFGGRRDLYAQQWFDERRRRGGYRPVRAPLTEAVVRAHLEGRLTLGQYLLDADGWVHFAVIDLDLTKSALAELVAARGEQASGADHPKVRAYAQALIAAGTALGLPIFAEDSGARGMHLWLFLKPRRSARAARMLLSQLMIRAGEQPPEITAELFPKQVALGPRGLSSLVKLPLGVHQVTLRRCCLLDEALAPLDDPERALAMLRAPEPAVVDAVLGGRLAALPSPVMDPVEDLSEAPPQTGPRTLASELKTITPGAAERDAAERMLAGCSVLARISQRAYAKEALSPAEVRAVVYSLGLLGRAPETARNILVATGASTKELERVARALPSPVGCRRLAALGAALGVRCEACPASRGAPYATPVVLALEECARPATSPRAAPWFGEEVPPIEDPMVVVGESLRRIEKRLSRMNPGSADGEEASDGSGLPDL